MEQFELTEIEAVVAGDTDTKIFYRDGRCYRVDETPLDTLENLTHQAGKSLYLLGKLARQFGASPAWEKPGLACISPMLLFVPVPLGAGKMAYVNVARVMGVRWVEDCPALRLQSGKEIRVTWTLTQFGKRWKNALDVRERYLSMCRHQLALAEILHV